MTDTVIEQLETEESMFVQTAQGIQSTNGDQSRPRCPSRAARASGREDYARIRPSSVCGGGVCPSS